MFRKNFKELETEKKQLKKDVDELEKQVKDLKKDAAQAKLDKKMFEEDIKHMTKMKEEKLEVAHEKKVIVLEKEKADAIAVVKDEYRDKLEERLKTEVENIKVMYGEILERLPNVNVRLKGDA